MKGRYKLKMIVGLLGIDFASSNRGCGALGYSAVEILNAVCKKRKEKLEVYSFVYKTKSIHDVWDTNVVMNYILIEPKKTSFWRTAYKIFSRCESVWDFTGGDSFSDIYGMKRFCLNSAVKQLAIWSKTRFVMAPQTIGPFDNKFAMMWAKKILSKSAKCFVRDSISEEYVKRTFGVIPLVTTDVAFSLPYKKVPPRVDEKIAVGINPSGLLWNGAKNFKVGKHVLLDYKEYMKETISLLCTDNHYVVFLIPHVFSKESLIDEDDLKVCYDLKKIFPNVNILCDFDTPMEAKQIVSSMDVFIGARMHATIAAFSTGVATIPVSYSRKFEGLYHDLGYPYIIGATHVSTQEAIEKTIDWVKKMDILKESVLSSTEKVKERQQILWDAIEGFCEDM